MLKAVVILLIGLFAIYLLIDSNIINLGQTENFVSKALDWSIDKYLKAKDVFFNETP